MPRKATLKKSRRNRVKYYRKSVQNKSKCKKKTKGGVGGPAIKIVLEKQKKDANDDQPSERDEITVYTYHTDIYQTNPLITSDTKLQKIETYFNDHGYKITKKQIVVVNAIDQDLTPRKSVFEITDKTRFRFINDNSGHPLYNPYILIYMDYKKDAQQTLHGRIEKKKQEVYELSELHSQASNKLNELTYQMNTFTTSPKLNELQTSESIKTGFFADLKKKLEEVRKQEKEEEERKIEEVKRME